MKNEAEVYKLLRNSIEFSSVNSNIKSILITSSKRGEGKTTIAANLAIIMAKSGKKTLLIDCDFTNPNIHDVFNLDNSTGLITILHSQNNSGQLYINTMNEANNKVVTCNEVATLACNEVSALVCNKVATYNEVACSNALYDTTIECSKSICNEAILNDKAIAKSKINNLYILPSGLNKNGTSRVSKDRTDRTNIKDIKDIKGIENIENIQHIQDTQDTEGTSELIMSNNMKQLFERITKEYDFIIVDTPAIQYSSDVQVISQYVDGCILVIRAGMNTRNEIETSKRLLQKVNARIIGAILNKADISPKSKKKSISCKSKKH
ncbi:tyrosine-protein kinase YwqD [Clostridium tepidiprofundi DSM 19306]|uniref:Tyrosine-protein kinase YwqD n=1 Tax=Clostridium tepidiprofundi DSM 19306 TaxID=1121338 RepID=A0A151B483_9CLOT|nr:CpsD/CapB family tyrosine-protein kinase [Clostridium tepidiprofundi]KYH34715.1 tyrosine-protein kinase YwqD [Clostridium tepidiprofundi DSM 19306]